MKKTTIAIILLLATLNNASGQTTVNQYDPSVKNVPTSPEVALLGRFGDIPVGHYTGTAEVSIPLYTLKIDNIEIPLALSYHTSGIKVADEATWAGLGWNFLPEGTITQEIRGSEDFVTGGDGFASTVGYNIFKSNFPTVQSENPMYRLQYGANDYNVGLLPGGAQPATDDSYDIISSLKNKKGQPDIFSYNFYGYSGRFFYNPENNSEILFLESNDDVKFSRNTDGWIATTNKGDKFYFYAIEKSTTDQTSTTDLSYTFKVSRIELVSGKVVTFAYQDESTYQQYPTQVVHLTNFTMNPALSSSSNAVINDKKTLIRIETEDTKIQFNLDNREDIRPHFTGTPIKKLSSVDILSKHSNKKIKSFVLNQDYFPINSINNTSEEGYRNKRLRLNSIQEVNYDQMGNPVPTSIPPYTFEYDTSKIMPDKMKSSDFYGYSNGEGSENLLPDLTYFDYFKTAPYKNYGLTPSSYIGTMRYTNVSCVTTNILKKISYPTGGRTEFEYESNTFTNQFIPTITQLQNGNKAQSITHRGASTEPGGSITKQSTLFKLPNNIIKFNNTIYDGYMGPLYPEVHYGDWTEIAKCKIQFRKRKTINGQPFDTVIKEWKVDVPGSVFEQTHQMTWSEEITVPVDTDPTTEYYVFVENGINYRSTDGSHRAVVSSDISYFDNTNIDTSISYGSGLRIKSLKNYENNTLLSHKEYTYNGGRLIYAFNPINLISGATSKSQPSSTTGGCPSESISIFNDISINSSDFGLGGNKSFGYSEVIEKDISVIDGTAKGYTKYYFTNIQGTYLKGMPKVDVPSNGENTLIEIFDQNQNKLSSKINNYDNLPNTYGVYPSFGIVKTSTGLYDPSNNFYPYQFNSGCPVIGVSYTGDNYQNPLPVTKYKFLVSPLITGKRRLKSTIETTFLGTSALVKKTELTYNASGNLDTSKLTTSDSQIIYTDYDYANDWGNTRLINKNMTGIPLSTKVTSDNKTLSFIQTKYDSQDNYLPTSVQSYDIKAGSWDTEVKYDKYDDKGNLLQYTTKSGVPVSLVWGYSKTYPIAKVEGLTYEQIGEAASAQLADILTASEKDANPAFYNMQPEDAENQLINKLDAFRTYFRLLNYNITTYSYDPLVGVRSITPPSGIRERYMYDAAGRLEKVVDMDGKVLKEMKYNYKN
ncbi:hypothetical protein [Chryseobacterium sp.]|uniref:hypothetical protein n=1 Tax=Chryseobacterium sp. TaxID=1871047 RepID=UPI001B25225A|nr:hypothetical protein [Chryseobacterium sp.]MBO9692959.1 hypothetical protein [Chryseobacterium sp.]